MNEAVFAALGGLAVAILGAVGAMVVQIWRQRDRSDDRAIKRYRELLDRIEKRTQRLEEHGEEQHEVIERLARDHADCQVLVAEIYGDLAASHETACRHAQALSELGKNPGAVPPLRPRPSKCDAHTEFLRRTSEQNDRLLHDPPPAPAVRDGGPTP